MGSATIEIFARLQRAIWMNTEPTSSATIEIFARLQRAIGSIIAGDSSATIEIFARLQHQAKELAEELVLLPSKFLLGYNCGSCKP